MFYLQIVLFIIKKKKKKQNNNIEKDNINYIYIKNSEYHK